MLIAKQIKELPKGNYKNSDLAATFSNHGKRHRQLTLPVDKNGLVIFDMMKHLAAGKPYAYVSMRLNRTMHKRFK